ncbi:MAG: lactate utilization protein B [Myxococcota bacterium]|nr:lactate utilization protein B [Myxococcota bacterium]
MARPDAAVFDLRRRRDAAAARVPDWEALRARAAALKRHALDHLDVLLERFEAQATRAGCVVHWAEDAAAHNRVVEGVLRDHGAKRVVKSKSMLTEECGLNAWLEARGIEVVDTDLGERIVQLGRERPSHLIVPAIHRTREEIGALFHREMGTPAGESDPERLTRYARRDLRARFLAADAGLTGANFAVASTGALVLVTNEGNADLGTALPPLHVASVGIEKLVADPEDLAVFLRLLARSATGQPLSAYTTCLRGPRPGGALHVVLVDNGRSRLLADPRHRDALACIRCGACLNTCPVYRRAGGHAYAATVPGPIGSVLAPARPGADADRALPFASSLCGSCSAVCPVGIDLHAQLLAWRREAPPRRPIRRAALRVAAAVMERPRLYRAAGALARVAWPLLGRRWPGNPAGAWLAERALPPHPGASFRVRWRRRRSRP